MDLLFIDDDEDIHEWHRDLFELTLPEAKLHFASNARNALDLCNERKFSLIVTDYQKPEMHGLDLSKI